MGGVTPDRSREVPIPERSGTAFRKGPGLARPIRSVPFRLQNLGCPGLRARGSLGPTPRALSGLLAPGAGASQHAGRAATPATVLRRLFLCFCFSRRSPVTRCRCCQGRPPVLLRVLVGSVAAVAVAQAKTAEWPRANTASRRWHWRSGDRPSCLSGPRRKEPRSAAERLLALETKFLLFWAGQEQDSVLSRSPAPHLDCSGCRRAKLIGSNALAIAYKAARSVADASEPRRRKANPR